MPVGRCLHRRGGTYNSTGPEESTVERWNGTSWAIQKDDAPARTTLFGVSCPSAQSCTAAGQNVSATGRSSKTGVAEHWNRSSWARQPTPVPHKTTTGAAIHGVSCLESLHRGRGPGP